MTFMMYSIKRLDVVQCGLQTSFRTESAKPSCTLIKLPVLSLATYPAHVPSTYTCNLDHDCIF